MQMQKRRNWDTAIRFAGLVMVLLSLTACSGKTDEPNLETRNTDTPVTNSPEVTSTLPATQTPVIDVPVVEIPGGFEMDTESGAMFAIVTGAPDGMGEPARIIDSQNSEFEEANYSFYVVPLRDNMRITVEIKDDMGMFFGEQSYTAIDEFTAALGAFYQVNGYIGPEESYPAYFYLRIVAQDGIEQGVYVYDHAEHGESGQYIVMAAKAPDRLEESAIRLLSGMAAGAVWRYGAELGWVDEIGLSATPITPAQLALSQASCRNALDNVVGMFYGYLPEPAYTEKTVQMAKAFFPGIDIQTLSASDTLTNNGEELLAWQNGSTILLTAASADGQTGYVIVGIVYEKDDSWFENMYRVDWRLEEPFDIHRPYQYHLVGVQPLLRGFPGWEVYQYLTERYLGAEALEALAEFGITHDVGYIDTPGIWVAEYTDMTLVRTIGTNGMHQIITYILLEDDDEAVVYLGAEAHAAYSPDDAWIDLGIIQMPSSWTYEMHIHDDITIVSDGMYEPLIMWAGWIMADSVESVVENSNYAEQFVFDDGHVGYMLFFDTHIMWVREDWMSFSLNHDADMSVFYDNEALILQVARTLTVE